MDKVDRLTLNYMSNNTYNEQREKKPVLNKTQQLEEEQFYKKRLLTNYKEYLKNLNKLENYDSNVIDYFHTFNKLQIDIFKREDKRDIVQKTNGVDKKVSFKTENAHEEELSQDKINLNDIEQFQKNQVKKCTLDNYIIKKPNKFKKETIVPTKINIDLQSQELKYKGVKKKNISNIYEDKKK
jgi:hypothetical protein